MATSEPKPSSPRRSRRRGRGNASAPPAATKAPVWPGAPGGTFRPLSNSDAERIHAATLNVLETVGMGDAPASVIDRVVAKGGTVTDTGRLTFPRALVEDVIANAERNFTLHGQIAGHELNLTGTNVHCGSGGAAPSVIDMETGDYRDATLRDLYDAARIADALENIHFFVRSVVARDMPTPKDMDINTAYACLRGTAKHVFVSASEASHVQPIFDMCAAIAGSSKAFTEHPFLSLNINHVVPPLRFDPAACAVMEEAALRGIPIQINSFDQAGASSPASLAGTVVQTTVEILAGLVVAWLINPNVRGIVGPRALVTDLRTGALTGGSGEHAVATAASIQMAQFYDLPNSCIAGGTDSKVPDAQSGYEKAISVALAAHSGCNLVTQACGMQASLMGCAFESYVIDNDMLGSIMRTVRGLELSDETLAQEVISEVVNGEGHFLGTSDTFTRMNTDYLYPQIADRQSIEEWEENGKLDMRARAIARTKELLSAPPPGHIDPAIDASIRASHNICLDL